LARGVQLQVCIWGAGPRLSEGSVSREINNRGTELLILQTFQTEGEVKMKKSTSTKATGVLLAGFLSAVFSVGMISSADAGGLSLVSNQISNKIKKKTKVSRIKRPIKVSGNPYRWQKLLLQVPDNAGVVVD
jgi:hypothetical protein